MLKNHARVQFYWRGINRDGQRVEGHIEAKNKSIATILLTQQEISVKHLKRSERYLRRVIRKKDIVAFLCQLATLLKANLPLMHALETMRLTQHHHTVRQLIESIQRDLQKGFSFSRALQQHPQYFTPVMCHLIAMGEYASHLDAIIFKLAYNQERRLQTQRQFYLALAYPLLITMVSLSLIIALCTFVLPQFLQFYQAFQVTLPKPTQYLITLIRWIKSYGAMSMSFMLLWLVTTGLLYQHYRPCKAYLDRLLLRLPILGALLSKLIMTRLTDTLSLSLSSGLPLIDALRLLPTIASNIQYEETFIKVSSLVREGVSLTKAMRLTHQFSPDVIEMIAIGEESGKLAHMFSEIATQLEETVSRHTLFWSKLLEPITVLFLGVSMGALLLALYLPIFQLGAVF